MYFSTKKFELSESIYIYIQNVCIKIDSISNNVSPHLISRDYPPILDRVCSREKKRDKIVACLLAFGTIRRRSPMTGRETRHLPLVINSSNTSAIKVKP